VASQLLDLLNCRRQQQQTPAARPSSSLTLQAEVQRLRTQLHERDAMVEQLRGDIAASKVCISERMCMPVNCRMTCQVLLDSIGKKRVSYLLTTVSREREAGGLHAADSICTGANQ
jgi:hypothetical protein